MPILIILGLLFSLSSFATKSHLSCSSNGTYLVFINGIRISDTGFGGIYEPTQIALLSAAKADARNIDSGLKVDGDIYRNMSESDAKDVAETFWLWLESTAHKSDFHKYHSQMIRFLTQNNLFYSGCSQDPVAKEVCDKIIEISLKKQNSSTNRDLGKIREAVVSKINEGKKIIFVTHSAGSSFADAVRDYIEKNVSEKANNNIGLLAIAPSLPSRHSNYYNFTFEEDALVNFIRGLRFSSPWWIPLPFPGQIPEWLQDTFVPPPPPGNYSIKQLCKPWDPQTNPIAKFEIPIDNHDVNCYFQEYPVEGSTLVLSQNMWPARMMILDSIFRVAGKLPNNDKNCCNEEPKGKLWVNPDTTLGGFVSDAVSIIGNPEISKGSQLCGTGYINSSSGSNRILNSKLLGEVELITPFDFSRVNSSKKSKIKNINSTSSLNSKLQLSDVEVDGNLTLSLMPNASDNSGYLNIRKSEFFGESRYLGEMIEIRNSKIYDGNVLGGMGRLYIDNLQNKKGFQAKIEILNTSPSNSTVSNLIIDKSLSVKAQSLQINNVTATGSIELSTPLISFGYSNVNNVIGQCDTSASIAVSMSNQSLNFSECESVSLGFSSTGNVNLKGSSTVYGSYNGINSSVGHSSAKSLDISSTVTGSTFISAPDGIGGGSTTVFGNLNLTSSCSKKASMHWQMASWTGDFAHHFSTLTVHTCFDYISGPLCYSYGTPCDEKNDQKL